MHTCFPPTPKKLAMTIALFASGVVLLGIGVHFSYVNVGPQQARTKARTDFSKAELTRKYGHQFPDN